MKIHKRHGRRWIGLSSALISVAAFVALAASFQSVSADGPVRRLRPAKTHTIHGATIIEEHPPGDLGGTWYWMRSPEQEKRVIAARYNRYCVRCHGTDGRGVWDIPDVPDLSNKRWLDSRSEGQLARAILEGRGAVMPAFRGTLTLEEAWAMGRYLRSFAPGSEVSPPHTDPPNQKQELHKPRPLRSDSSTLIRSTWKEQRK